MSTAPEKKARIRAFRRLFIGVSLDLYREARLARRVGIEEARRRMSKRHRKRAIQFRETASEMGGVVIKLGQYLSARADMMPEEYLQELSKLQDEVPPVPFEGIKGVIEDEFGRPLDEVYASFERDPIAAASLGQVHGAQLPDGTAVAVKVQRPGIEDLVDIDLATLAWLMDGAYRFTKFGRQFDIPGLVNEFARTLNDELDFLREGSYAERFCDNFYGHRTIYVPDVHWDYTTDRVLTLERVHGIKISDYEAIEEAGIDRREVADEVFQSYMKQVLGDGFFHADPHPGNLFVVKFQDGVRVTFVDFGMVGEITDAERDLFKDGVIAGSRKDYDGLVRALARLGFIKPGASVEPIKRAIAFVFEQYSGLTTHRVSYEELEAIQEDIRTLVYEQPFALPSQFGFLGRAIGTMIGLVSGLDPHYDFVEAVKPYVRQATRNDPAFVLRTALGQAQHMARRLIELPDKVDALLTQTQKGDLKVRIDAREYARSAGRSSWDAIIHAFSIWAAALVICGVILYVMEAVDFAVAFWAASLLTMVALLLPVGRRKRKRGLHR